MIYCAGWHGNSTGRGVLLAGNDLLCFGTVILLAGNARIRAGNDLLYLWHGNSTGEEQKKSAFGQPDGRMRELGSRKSAL